MTRPNTKSKRNVKLILFLMLLAIPSILYIRKSPYLQTTYIVDSVPSDAKIIIGNKESKTPTSITITDDKFIHKIQIEKEGYYTFLGEKDFSKISDKKLTIKLDPILEDNTEPIIGINIRNFYSIDTSLNPKTYLLLNPIKGILVYNDGSGFKELMTDKLYKLRSMDYSEKNKMAIVEAFDLTTSTRGNALIDFSNWNRNNPPIITPYPVVPTATGFSWNLNGDNFCYLLPQKEDPVNSNVYIYDQESKTSSIIEKYQFSGGYDTFFVNNDTILVAAHPADGYLSNDPSFEYGTGFELHLLLRKGVNWSKRILTDDLVSQTFDIDIANMQTVFMDSKNIILANLTNGNLSKFPTPQLNENPNKYAVIKDKETVVYLYKIDDKTVMLNYLNLETKDQKQIRLEGEFMGNLTNFQKIKDGRALISTSRGYNLLIDL